MSERPEKFSFQLDADEFGEFVTGQFTLRNVAQIERAISMLRRLDEFVRPSVDVHFLAAEQFVGAGGPEPNFLPALKLVA